VTFRITPEAVGYIRQWLKPDLVLTFSPSMPVPSLWPEGEDSPPLEEITRLAQEATKRLPKRMILHWQVGGHGRSRLPQEECRIVDGIEVHIPPELEEPLASRVLKLEKGELVFDPPLEPVIFNRPD